MATGTYNWGQSLAKNVISLGCTMAANQYPNGTFTLTSSGGSYFYMDTTAGTTYTFYGSICDSGGGCSHQCCSMTIDGASSVTSVSGSISGAQDLKGKALYLKFYGNSMNDQLQIRGSMDATIGTATVPDTSYTASTFTAADVYFGDVSTVNISNAKISALKHEVTWSVGSHSKTQTTSKGATSSSYTIPTSWLDAAPSSTSVTLTIKVKTLNGSTQVGSIATKTYNAKVATSLKPSITSVSADVYNQQSGFSGRYIQGITGVSLTINGASAPTGTSIDTYTLTCNKTENIVQDSTNKNKFTITRLSNSGSLTFTAKVKDKRSRESDTKTVTINVDAYARPSISSVIAYRSLSNGVADDEGRYITLRCNATYSAISNNTLTINSVYWKTTDPDTTYTAQSNMTSGAQYTIGNNTIDPAFSYTVRFTAQDSLGNSTVSVIDISTTMYSIHVKNGGDGVSFGKTSERSNAVDINKDWGLYYKGHVMPSDYVLSQNSSTTHSFYLPSNSYHYVMLVTTGSVNAWWVGLLCCKSEGTIEWVTLHNGGSCTVSSSTNTFTFTLGSAAQVSMRVMSIYGNGISNL